MPLPQLQDFVAQLLNSKTIKDLPPLEKEDAVVAFVAMNEATLKARFATEEYFPNLDWSNVKSELFKTLGDFISAEISPRLEALIKNLNLDWKAKYQDFMVSDEKFRDNLIGLSTKLASRPASRRNYAKIVDFINNSVIHPYIMTAYQTTRYIYTGLSRFDQINYKTPDEAMSFLFCAMLFMPLFDITLPMKVVMPQYTGPMTKSLSFRDTEDNSVLRQSFIIKIKEIMNKEFPGVSPYFVEIITKSQYLNEDQENVPYSSKVLKIMYNFAKDWKKTRRERGAESFDASWFNVARINHKFYAYDLGTLDEFYKITIEEDL